MEIVQTERERLRAASDAATAASEQRFCGRNWRETGTEYFRAQRQTGLTEMGALLQTLKLAPPLSKDGLSTVLMLASDIFLGAALGDARLIPIQDGGLRLEVAVCPMYHRLLEERSPHQPDGMTACSCTSRRQGWYDALQVVGWDEVMTNKKWGDPSCAAIIHIE
jgi:hypothetical protein